MSGSDQVQALQTALRNLAKAANWPAADPGQIDGIVGVKTMGAVLTVIQNVKEIPGSVKTALLATLTLAMANTDSRAEAYGLIARFAPELTAAIAAAIAKYSGSTQPSSPHQITSFPAGAATAPIKSGSGSSFWKPPPGTPWYKQGRVYAIGGGIAALGAGAFFLFRR